MNTYIVTFNRVPERPDFVVIRAQSTDDARYIAEQEILHDANDGLNENSYSFLEIVSIAEYRNTCSAGILAVAYQCF